MAIKTFKEILQNKGYRIESNDRQIFENGTVQSFFGFSDNDLQLILSRFFSKI